MQQKKIGDILYVFDVTPYEITQDTDVSIIKVQQEVVAGFKELNASLADKIVSYNYHAMVVNVPEWAPYVDDVSPELAWSTESATVTIGADDNVFPTLTNPHNVTVTYSSSDTEKATIDQSTGAITLLAAGNTTISATFAGNDTYYEQTVSYALTVQTATVYHTVTLTGAGLSDETVIIKNNNETVALAESYQVAEDTWFEIFPLEDPSNYTLVSDNMQFENDPSNYHWYTTVPEDVTIELNYSEPVVNYYTITLAGTDIDQSQLSIIDMQVGELISIEDAMGGVQVEAGHALIFTVPAGTESDYDFTNSGLDYNSDDNYYFMWVSVDATVTIDYTVPENNEEEQPE